MALCVIGPTRTGKTCFFRSLGEHVYWNSTCIFATQDWQSAMFLIVDDVEWEFFKCRKQLLGGQSSFGVTEKYKGLMEINFGKPVVYLCNTDPRDQMTANDVAYYNGNVVYYVMDDDEKFF